MTKPNNEAGYETENPGAQDNYDALSTIYDELLQLESDLNAMDDKITLLFGDKRKSKYDLTACANKIARITRTIDEDAMGYPRAEALYLMSYDEQRHLF